MRARVRVILTFWLFLAIDIPLIVAAQLMDPNVVFWLAFGALILAFVVTFTIWRTQPTFRRLMHWASAGTWPKDMAEGG